MEEDLTFNLLELIYGLVEQLMLNTEYKADDISSFIDTTRNNIDTIKSHYQDSAPQAAKAVEDLMLESLSLFDTSLSEIALFLEDQDEDRLRKAISLADEAHDVLGAIEEVIQNNKNFLAEMAEA